MTWRQSNITTTDKNVCLPVTSLNNHANDKLYEPVGLKQVHLRKDYSNQSNSYKLFIGWDVVRPCGFKVFLFLDLDPLDLPCRFLELEPVM